VTAPLQKLLVLGLWFQAVCLLPASAASGIFTKQASWKYLIGSQEASLPDVTAWRTVEFDDGTWPTGQGAFYYEANSGYTGNTDLIAMRGLHTSVYLRKTFLIENPADVARLDLDVEVDDGCIIWINGLEQARLGVDAGQIPYNGTGQNANPEPRTAILTLTNAASFLQRTNVVAVHLLNQALNSSDLLFDMSMESSALDLIPPVLAEVQPPEGSLSQLTQVTVVFSEPVTGVNASDLLINGLPSASSVLGGEAIYTFFFPQPPFGTVLISWNPAHGIRDLGIPSNPFNHTAPGAAWSYQLVDSFPPVMS